jgi:2-keto-3-deoxy-L-rhamnonate aldolase RhmA
MWVKKALDSGAAGIIVPHIDSPEQAAQAVRWGQYPPAGARSVGFTRATMYGRRFEDYLARANAETALIAQVEHIDGVRTIEAIAAVAGIAGVLIGPFDLSASLNKTGRLDDPEVRAAIDRVGSVCAVKGMPVGIYAKDVPAAREAFEAGYSFVCVGVDAALYASAGADIVKALKP